MTKPTGKPRKPQAPRDERAITPRLLQFAHAFAKCGKATEAAQIAGYGKVYAKQRGHRLLQDPRVQAEIARIQSVASRYAEVEVKDILRELKAIAFADMADFAKWKGGSVTLTDSALLDTIGRRAVSEVRQTQHGASIKLHDKIAALTLLAKHLNMLIEKVEHSGEVKSTAPVINLTLTQPAKEGSSG